jgi:hypothetical protein
MRGARGLACLRHPHALGDSDNEAGGDAARQAAQKGEQRKGSASKTTSAFLLSRRVETRGCRVFGLYLVVNVGRGRGKRVL